MSRRSMLGGGAAALAVFDAKGARAQDPHAAHRGLYGHLRDPGRTDLPGAAEQQRFTYSPAPVADPAGVWAPRAPLPLPRSEMAWAVASADRLHVIGGYGEGRVDRPYHHVYDPGADRWSEAAALPRGMNHVGVAEMGGTIYACGGFVEQNRVPAPDCYAFVAAEDRWHPIRPFAKGTRGAVSLVAFEGRIHAIGGRDTRSLDWHEIYDPASDRWEAAAPIPGPRDHTAAVVIGGAISVVGGRMDTYDFNTGMHVSWDGVSDRWTERAPMPTPRSGHGAALYRGRLFVVGGEGTKRVFGQTEAYDAASDGWTAFAPMPTPRHGLGAAVVGDALHVAGGGPVQGGPVQSAVHEAFTL